MPTIQRLTVLVTAVLSLSLAACGSEKPRSKSPYGSIAISASLSDADVASVSVTVSGAGIATPMTASLTKVGAEWTGTIADVPVGTDRTVQAQGRDAGGTLIYEGSATGVAVNPGATTAVVIVMQQVEPPPPNDDNAPVIDGVVASDLTPLAGDTITLDVTAHDVDAGAVLSYLWTATGGTFNPSPASAAHVEWSVPDPNTVATYTITVTVTDEKGLAATLSFDLGVPLTAGSLQLNVTTNTWPAVTAMTAAPTSVAAGTPIAFTAATSDSDGDAVTVTWTADCAGDFSAATGASISFTPSATPVGNLCTVRATATDGKGGTGVGSRGVWVGLGAPPVTEGCGWTQVASHDLALLPAGWTTRNGGYMGQGPADVYGRTAWYQQSDWNQIWGDSGLSGIGDVMAVEADFYMPTPPSPDLGAFIAFYSATSDHWVFGGIQAFTDTSADVIWGNNMSLAGPATLLRRVASAHSGSAWQRMRLEYSVSACRYRLLLDGSELDSWTAPCEPAPTRFFLQSSGPGFQSTNVAWSNLRVLRGNAACAATLPASCSDVLTSAPASPSGTYTIDPDGPGGTAPYSAYCDMTTAGGGWTLALAYAHPEGDTKDLVPGVAPTSPTAGYGHLSAAQLSALPFGEMRFYCQTTNHPRKVHAVFSDPGAIAYVRGTGSNAVSHWTTFTTLADHTASIPAAVDYVSTAPADERITNHTFFAYGTNHWNIHTIDGDYVHYRFECDDYTTFIGYAGTTLHQVWVR